MNTTDKKILFRLAHSDTFKVECQKVREEIRKAETTVSRDRKTGNITVRKYNLKDTLIFREPYRIAREFGLPSEWAKSIRDHIMTERPIRLPQAESLWQFDRDSKRWELFAPLHRKTNQTDLEYALKSTKKIRKSLKEVQPKKITRRDLLLAKGYKEDKSMKDIKTTLDTNNENMEEESVRRRLVSVRRELGIGLRPKKSPKKLST